MRKITLLWLPVPISYFEGIGFVRRKAVPAFEDLFAGVVVPGGSQVRIMEPTSIRIITRVTPSRLGSIGFNAIDELEGLMRSWNYGGFVKYRESKKNGNEADKRE